jgi:hypothetical protein
MIAILIHSLKQIKLNDSIVMAYRVSPEQVKLEVGPVHLHAGALVCYSLGLPTQMQLLEAATAKEKRGLTMNAKHRIISLLCC